MRAGWDSNPRPIHLCKLHIWLRASRFWQEFYLAEHPVNVYHRPKSPQFLLKTIFIITVSLQYKLEKYVNICRFRDKSMENNYN